MSPIARKSEWNALWILGGVTCVLLLFIGIIFPSMLSKKPGPKETLQHFEGDIDYSKQTHDHIKSDLYVRASAALKSGDAQSAEALYKQIIAKYPDDPDGFNALGACMVFEERFEEARTNYLRAVVLNSQSVDALYGLGCVAYKLKRNAEARDYLEKALALREQDSLCHRLLGIVYEELGDKRSAELHYERAIALDPSVAGDAVIRERLQELKR